MRLIALLLGSALFALPSSADACSCGGWTDLPTALRTARDGADVIVRGRVVSVASGQVRIEVLEAFKGTTGGTKLVVDTDSGGGDCRYAFEFGEQYFVYASRYRGRLATSMCTRTRKVSKGDVELDWLRTGRLPPVPVALRREQAQCTPCSLERVATGLTGQRGLSPGAEEATQAQALKTKRPFWAGGYSGRDDQSPTTAVGLSLDLRPFELLQLPSRATDETCQQRVTRKWCERLEMAPARDSQGHPRLRCVNPELEKVICDERKSRQARWSPKERMAAARCQWLTADRAICLFHEELQPLAPETGTPWVLACKPQHGFERVHRCQVVPSDALP